MKNLLLNFTKDQVKRIAKMRNFEIPSFESGDSVSVKYKITESGNTRIQSFNGVVVAKTKNISNYSSTFTVRKVSNGVGVERKFSTHSPLLAGVEILKHGEVRRAKLYYLSKLTGKASRIKEKINFIAKGREESSEQA